MSRYLREEHGQTQYSNLEVELHDRYPIKGAGVRATKLSLAKLAAWDGGFFYDEEPVAPETVVPLVEDFPLDAASVSYIFALMEGHGADLLSLVHPTILKPRQAWHSPIDGELDISDTNAVWIARRKIARRFRSSPRNFTRLAVVRVVRLKKIRNEIAHEAETGASFRELFPELLAVICHLHFMCLPNDPEIVFYPWEDHDGTFRT